MTLPKSCVQRKVPFYDVDSMQVLWHGHYVKYLERGRCELLDSIDYGYKAMQESGHAWPVVKLSLRYARPCVFGQTLQIQTQMIDWEYRLVMDYKITDAESGKVMVKASSTQVPVEIDTGETCFGSPEILKRRLMKHGYL